MRVLLYYICSGEYVEKLMVHYVYFLGEYVSIMLDITDCVLQKITNTLKN